MCGGPLGLYATDMHSKHPSPCLCILNDAHANTHTHAGPPARICDKTVVNLCRAHPRSPGNGSSLLLRTRGLIRSPREAKWHKDNTRATVMGSREPTRTHNFHRQVWGLHCPLGVHACVRVRVLHAYLFYSLFFVVWEYINWKSFALYAMARHAQRLMGERVCLSVCVCGCVWACVRLNSTQCIICTFLCTTHNNKFEQ